MKINLLIIAVFILVSMKGKAQNDYYVCFFGEKVSIPASPVGHAFIGIGKGTPLTCDLNAQETEMVGFYPSVRVEGGKSFWLGPVDGKIKPDIKTQIDDYSFKKISFADYIKVKLKIDEWLGKKYQVTRQDCISFFIAVGEIFPDVVLPDRSRFVTPDDYVRNFIEVNKILSTH
jgi:hypothetical protein